MKMILMRRVPTPFVGRGTPSWLPMSQLGVHQMIGLVIIGVTLFWMKVKRFVIQMPTLHLRANDYALHTVYSCLELRFKMTLGSCGHYSTSSFQDGWVLYRHLRQSLPYRLNVGVIQMRVPCKCS